MCFTWDCRPFCFQVTNLQLAFCAHVPLLSSRRFGTSQGEVLPYGWEGNHRSGVVVAIHQWFIHLQAGSRTKKGRCPSSFLSLWAYTPRGVWHLCLYSVCHRPKLTKIVSFVTSLLKTKMWMYYDVSGSEEDSWCTGSWSLSSPAVWRQTQSLMYAVAAFSQHISLTCTVQFFVWATRSFQPAELHNFQIFKPKPTCKGFAFASV